MIDFEEELKKFHPSLEVEDVEDTVMNQDVTDLAASTKCPKTSALG